jgi:hypothetical protein
MPWRIALVAMLVLSALDLAIPNVTNAQSGTATLTIHSRFCPAGYDGTEIFETCHDNVGIRGVQYTLSGIDGRADIPDETGNLVFSDLRPDDYRISTSLPSDLNRSYVYCTNSDGSDGRQISTSVDDYYGEFIEWPLLAGDDITCDWYAIPNEDYNITRANITIHNRFCPPDYTDFGNEWQDCLPNVGFSNLVRYSIDGPTPRGNSIRSGNVSLNWIEPGTYEIHIDTVYDYNISASAYCSTMDSLSVPFLSTPLAPGESLTFSVDPGDDVICDWYEYPTSAFYSTGAETPISVIACEKPEGLGLFMGGLPDGCKYLNGIEVTAYPSLAGPAYAQTCVTGSPGGCIVHLQSIIPLTAEIDLAALPEGYAPSGEYPYTWSQYGEWTGAMLQVNPIDAGSKGD